MMFRIPLASEEEYSWARSQVVSGERVLVTKKGGLILTTVDGSVLHKFGMENGVMLCLRLRDINPVCPNCHSLGLVKTYSHPNGISVEGIEGLQWVYIDCQHCHTQTKHEWLRQ
jgi:hypothetical protein